ncbi:MAG TPA: hypothetical protein RMH85_02515 [Polyangiaceae bacterium LLY-WYZ-15_(1-7)]|nr:hypothetical protein [Sandaracinus sp.]HJL04553.1 hypothetical protein [Polyangiaceae bacterium LLY-WYZ-15_(1-7)]MBJ70956.1 hypothetical protein [Sandaracinus sp.]HJL07335.1 hypothetical protein [Polyangiaceae bacterium LLY-WYZ-15_(1-7)]HJL27222.1 hypothetical protein [Polyangiaceae bacterium LLY-WYZ-15_(1-7)]
MALGFAFRQRLRGTYHRLSDPGVELPVSLDVAIELPLGQLLRDGRGRLGGHFDAEGYATRARLEGTFGLDLGKRKLVYDFHFPADDGRERRFHGETAFELRQPVRTMEDLVGRLYDEDREDARVLLRVPMTTGIRTLLRTARAGFTTRMG